MYMCVVRYMTVYKYKNQLKMTKASRDGGAKKYTNKGSRENVWQGSPYSSNCVSMKNVVRDEPCHTFSLLPLFVYFFCTAIPTCFCNF